MFWAISQATLADIIGHGLALFRPLAILFDISHAVRAQNSHYLIGVNLRGPLRDDEVDQIVGVGQCPAVASLYGDRAVQSQRANVFSRSRHVFRISVESMHNVAIVHPQRGGQPAVTAAQMND